MYFQSCTRCGLASGTNNSNQIALLNYNHLISSAQLNTETCKYSQLLILLRLVLLFTQQEYWQWRTRTSSWKEAYGWFGNNEPNGEYAIR